MDKIYILHDIEHGDFVKCSDCEAASVIQIGGEQCPICGSFNLSWADDAHQEIDVKDAESKGQFEKIFCFDINLPFSGFYYSIWYNENMEFEEAQLEADNLGFKNVSEFLEIYEFDFITYQKDVVEEYKNYFLHEILDTLPGFKALLNYKHIPCNDYFYGNDKINISFTASFQFYEFLESFISEHYNELRDRIREDWSDRSGFWSFLSNNIEYWRLEMYRDNRYVQELIHYYVDMQRPNFEEEAYEYINPTYIFNKI